MTDLVLAIAHHFAAFALAGLLAAEIVLLRPGLAGDRLRQIGRVDAAYGVVAGLIVVIGVLRVIFGDKGADYYMANWAFWLKMVSFAVVGLLSVPPTLAILRWGRQLRTQPDFVPEPLQVRQLRNFFIGEIIAFALIPIFAAAMARGYGLF